MVFTEAKLERDLHCQEAANTRQTKLYTHSAFATAVLNQSSCCFPNRLAATTLRVKWWGYSFVKLAVYMSSPITSRHWHRPISLNNKITNCQADFFSFIQNVYYKVQHPQNANYSIYRRNRKSNLKILKASSYSSTSTPFTKPYTTIMPFIAGCVNAPTIESNCLTV